MKRPNAVERAAIEACAARRVGGHAFENLRKEVEAAFPGAIMRANARRKKEAFEAKFVGSPPSWAKAMVATLAPELIQLRWRRSRVKEWPSGRCYGRGEIVVTVGFIPNKIAERYVLLHEIAHWKSPLAGHGDRFWDTFRHLLVQQGMYRKALDLPWPKRNLVAAARRARNA